MTARAGIDAIIEDYRSRIAALDADVSLQIGREWLAVENRLRADIDSLAYEIDRRRLAGEVINEQLFWLMEKYRVTLAQVQEQVNRFNGAAVELVESKRRETYMMGVSRANELLAGQYSSVGVFTPFWERLNLDSFEAAFGATSGTTPLWRTFANNELFLSGFRTSLLDTVARGGSVVQLAEAMVNGLRMGVSRAMMIAQTEMARAYRHGTVGQYRASGVVKMYKRLVKKDTACLACLLLDGELYRVADDMQDHPRGYCDVIAWVVGLPEPRWDYGRDWLERQSDDFKLRLMGRERFDLWQSGSVPKNRFARFSDFDPEWGSHPQVTPVRDLRRMEGRDDLTDDLPTPR